MRIAGLGMTMLGYFLLARVRQSIIYYNFVRQSIVKFCPNFSGKKIIMVDNTYNVYNFLHCISYDHPTFFQDLHLVFLF